MMKAVVSRTSFLAAAPVALALIVGGMSPASSVEPAQQGRVSTQVSGAASMGVPGIGRGGVCSLKSSAAGPTTAMTQIDARSSRDAGAEAAAAITSGDVAIQVSRDSLEFDEMKVYDIDAGESGATSVTIPVGGDFSAISNVTLLLDRNGDVTTFSETLIEENDAGNFRVTTFVEGELVSEKNTDVAYLTDAQLQRQAQANPTALGTMSALGAGTTAACVAAVLGVSGVTAYLIVGACTGACAVPGVGTAVCVACIGAYATVGGASIAAVASCF